MLITCPQCLTNYDVPLVLEETGQKVKCAKCGCVWEIDNGNIEPEPEDLPEFNQEEDLSFDPLPAPEIEDPDLSSLSAFQDFLKQPEKKTPSFLKWIRPLYFLSLLFIAASIYLFFFHPAIKAPVTLQTLAYQTVEKDYKTYLVLRTAAYNNTDREIVPKTFTVRFSDQDDRLLTTTAVVSPVDVLPAKSMEKIDLEIERPPSQTAKAVVTLTKFETR